MKKAQILSKNLLMVLDLEGCNDSRLLCHEFLKGTADIEKEVYEVGK